MTLNRVLDLVTPFLYEEERVLTFISDRTLHSQYRIYLHEVKGDFLRLLQWDSELRRDEDLFRDTPYFLQSPTEPSD